ncbi:MAG: heme-binding protein [Chloroflexi bacterium]|nr:heme-binding protein [Chloroflexota bacterium]MCH8090454.1 heme-binding protein [Chloroflexota bacterium]
MPLSLEVAEKMLQAAKAKAVDMECSVSVAIVDSGGYVITVSRMDGAVPLTANAAADMAYTAAMFRAPGDKILPFASRPWFQSLVISTGGKLVPAEGEMPIEVGGSIVGGIGAAGGTTEQDVACCQAALTALKNNFR